MIGDTAASIINDAALELGIGQPGTLTPAGADPWGSTDNNILKLIGYLKSGGQELVREREWNILTKEYTFLSVGGQEAYPAPADFRSVSTRTGWDRTNRYPLGGPLDGIEWQYVKGILAGNPLILYFRAKQQQFFLAGGANVPAGHTVAYEYTSTWWAGVNGSSIPLGGITKEFPTQGNDVVFLESMMMVQRLKHDFGRNNGLGDTYKEQYLGAKEKAMNDDSQMPVLSLTRKKYNNLLSGRNLPPTGWGVN
jgi:hypothetical protein